MGRWREAGRLTVEASASVAWSRPALPFVVALMLASVAMQFSTWFWYVEDAAISFAYADNLAAGEGLVAYPGGERIEGYSNPLWVALLTLGSLSGLEGFAFARFLGCLFGAFTVPVVWSIARELRAPAQTLLPLVACVALVGNVQFAIWNGSGLENSLFSLLLAGGILATLVEAKREGPPWSALFFLALAVTRPEGILYGAIGGGAALLFRLQDGRSLLPIATWLALFFVPFSVYHAVRYQYFAWLLPNTYYAKVAGAGGLSLLDWNGGGWIYLRDFSGLAAADLRLGPGLGLGYLLPLYVAGALFGTPRWSRWLWPAAFVVLFLLLFPLPSDFGFDAALDPGALLALIGVDQAPSFWLSLRVAALWSAMAGVAAYSLLGGASRAVSLCWAMGSACIVFTVSSRGDWMEGYRWLSMAAVPGSVLLAAGVSVLNSRLSARPPRLRWGVLLVIFVLFLAPQIRHLVWFADNQVLSPKAVKKRVAFWESTRRRMHIEEFLLLDPDMGATLYWSDAPVLDIAGLVDIPIARHHYGSRFLHDYVFVERRPEFAHVHLGWSAVTSLPHHQQWREQYLRIPGYGRAARPHGGNHVRRDLLMRPRAAGAATIAHEQGLEIERFALPAQPSRPGGTLYLELWIRWTGEPPVATDLLELLPLRLRRGEEIAFEGGLLAGYGWVHPVHWKGESFAGRYSIPLPESLAPGRYDLGLATGSSDAPTWFADAVVVVTPDEFDARLASDWRALEALLVAGDCEAGEAAWDSVRLRMHADRAWLDARQDAARALRARCWAQLARRSDDPRLRVEAWVRSGRLDHRSPELAAGRRALADELYAEGLEVLADARQQHAQLQTADALQEDLARELETWRRAYWLFSDAVRVDPTRAWARRHAEEARPHQLGLLPTTAAWRLRLEVEHRPGEDPIAPLPRDLPLPPDARP